VALPKIARALASPTPVAFRTNLLKTETQVTATLCSVPGRIYARAELAEYFYKVRAQGLLAKHTKLEQLIEFLVQRRRLLFDHIEVGRIQKSVHALLRKFAVTLCACCLAA
jgi:hypothetical protein